MYYTVCSKDAIISWEAKSSTPKISALSHWTLKILSIQLARITCLSREQERFLIGEPWTASDLSTCTVYNPEELPEHSWSQVVSYNLWISVFADSLDAFLTWCFSLKYWGFFCILVISCLSLMTDNHSHSLCGGSICSMQKKLLQVPSLKTMYCSNLPCLMFLEGCSFLLLSPSCITPTPETIPTFLVVPHLMSTCPETWMWYNESTRWV